MRVLPSLPAQPPFQLTLRAAVACYAMTPASHGVLFWITASYFFLSAALQWERFLFFFVRDCVTATIPAAKAVASSAYFICLAASACGAICYGAFACSQRLGDRRCWLVSTFGLCAMTALMIAVHSPQQLYFISLAFGVFNGLFLSSSFSLAVQHIPHGHQESLRYSRVLPSLQGWGGGGGGARIGSASCSL
jgi:MFS family permease